jgi:hypothetical protein
MKLVLGRLFTTAILPFLATPFEHTLNATFIESIQMILVFDMSLTPILRAADVYDRALQTFIAPRSKSEAMANTFFEGTKFYIAERYTDLLKTGFLALLYISINPSGIFLASIAFAGSYWADKYLLLRRWKSPDPVNAEIVFFSNFLLKCVIVLSVLFTSYFYSNWSYDNVCAVEPTCWSNATTRGNNCIVPDNLRAPGGTFITCPKKLGSFIWPEPQAYMTAPQVETLKFCRLVSVVVLCFFFLFSIVEPLAKAFRVLFVRKHTNHAAPSPTHYSEIIDDKTEEIDAYVPNYYDTDVMARPIIMCDLNFLDEDMEVVSFAPPYGGTYYDCTAYNKDFFPALMSWTDSKHSHPSFSVCKYYGADPSYVPTSFNPSGKPVSSQELEGILSDK